MKKVKVHTFKMNIKSIGEKTKEPDFDAEAESVDINCYIENGKYIVEVIEGVKSKIDKLKTKHEFVKEEIVDMSTPPTEVPNV